MVTKLVMYGGLGLLAVGGYWYYTDPAGFSQFAPHPGANRARVWRPLDALVAPEHKAWPVYLVAGQNDGVGGKAGLHRRAESQVEELYLL